MLSPTLWAANFNIEIFLSERRLQFLYFQPEGTVVSVLSFKFPDEHPHARSTYVICTSLESVTYSD